MFEKKEFKNPVKETKDIRNKGYKNLSDNWDKVIKFIEPLIGDKDVKESIRQVNKEILFMPMYNIAVDTSVMAQNSAIKIISRSLPTICMACQKELPCTLCDKKIIDCKCTDEELDKHFEKQEKDSFSEVKE